MLVKLLCLLSADVGGGLRPAHYFGKAMADWKPYTVTIGKYFRQWLRHHLFSERSSLWQDEHEKWCTADKFGKHKRVKDLHIGQCKSKSEK